MLAVLALAGCANAPETKLSPGVASAPTGNARNWGPYITEASQRFNVPEEWIRAVMQRESGGRTYENGKPITSPKGAMGLMQVMPETWAELRARHNLGSNPYDPHDNILAGTAYIREMYEVFGNPGFLGAYNAGPARYAEYLERKRALPRETRNYIAAIAPQIASIEPGSGSRPMLMAEAAAKAEATPTPTPVAPPAPPPVVVAAVPEPVAPPAPRPAPAPAPIPAPVVIEQRQATPEPVQLAALPPTPAPTPAREAPARETRAAEPAVARPAAASSTTPPAKPARTTVALTTGGPTGSASLRPIQLASLETDEGDAPGPSGQLALSRSLKGTPTLKGAAPAAAAKPGDAAHGRQSNGLPKGWFAAKPRTNG